MSSGLLLSSTLSTSSSSNYLGDLLTNVSLGSQESLKIDFTYAGALPFQGNISVVVKDSVSEFSLCFNSVYSIPVSLAPCAL